MNSMGAHLNGNFPLRAARLHRALVMFSRSMTGRLDGGEHSGVPDAPPNEIIRELKEDDPEIVDPDSNDDLFWEDGDPADRRRDPLRK